jgi:hypothetical protein
MTQTYSAIVDGCNKSYSFNKLSGTIVEMIEGKPVARAMTGNDLSLLFAELKRPALPNISNSDIQKGILSMGGAK